MSTKRPFTLVAGRPGQNPLITQAPTNPAPPTSRYAGLAVAQLTNPDGRTVPYLRRRFIPSTDRFTLLTEHQVEAGERPDQVAAKYLGDPEQSWRLCDANGVMHPTELTESPGERIRITLPQGVPGAPPYA